MTVDGTPAHVGQRVDPEGVSIEVDGVPLPVRPGLGYFLLYKPRGVISSASDPQGRTTVVDLVATELRVYPVGRLDADSEGLVLLTNDGDLTNLVTHPRYGVEKTYVAVVEGSPGRSIRRLVTGVELDDGPASAVRARVVEQSGGRTMVEVVMREGRKREVRRMLDAIGYAPVRLIRTAIGPIRDRSLAAGEWRPLQVDEVRALYSAGSDAWDDESGPSRGSS